MSRFDLTIGEFASRTGVSDATLRIWERRYGFPEPLRTARGHRRYAVEQAQAVARVLAMRESGLSIRAAIARAQAPVDPDTFSLFCTLRDLRADLQPRAVRKPVLVALSHAIEDEALARAQALVAFGCFQRERFYRSSQARWRELASAAHAAAVFADFHSLGAPASGPLEVPIARHQQIWREWAIILHGGSASICMVARELASSNVEVASRDRTFELLWSVDPGAVSALARVCVEVLRTRLPEAAARAEHELMQGSSATPAELLRLTTAVVDRMLPELA
ncbi:MAG: DICT sensory domain-containing protein [Actinomycetota bacterium]|nr:DICT sensory domain-containing protein [Actinomycetota bacterium]